MYFEQHVSLYLERCKFIHFFAASRISRKSLFAIFGFGELGTYPLRLSFAICRIRGVSLISAFKRTFLLSIVLYAKWDKFALTGKLMMRTDHLYIQLYIYKQVARAIGQGSTGNKFTYW